MNVKVTQLCLTLCEPMGYTVQGIHQARILEYPPFSRGSSNRGIKPRLPHCRWILYQLNHTVKGQKKQPRQCSVQSVQLLSRVWLFVTPWAAAHQASLPITNSRSLLKLMSIESVMPSNCLIFCRPLLLLPSIFPSIRQGLFKWVNSLHQVAKVLEFQLQHHSFQWIFRTDFL